MVLQNIWLVESRDAEELAVLSCGLFGFLTACRVGAPNMHIVQGQLSSSTCEPLTT